MQISVELISPLKRRVKVVLLANRFEEEFDSQLKEVAKKARIDGFRPGKVPASIVKKLYQQAIETDTTEKLLKSTLPDVLKQEELNMVPNSLVVESVRVVKGEPFEYIAFLEVYPEIEPIEASSISIEKWIIDIAESDLNTVLSKILRQHAKWKEENRPAIEGDQITVSFEDEKADNTQIQLIEPIEERFKCLLGLSVGDEQSIDWFKNKPSRKIKILKIESPILPELTNEFVKEHFEEETVENFKEAVKKTLQKQIDNAIASRIKNELIQQLLEKTSPFELPESFVKTQQNRLLQEESQKRSLNDPTLLPEEVKTALQEKAKEQVRIGLIFSALGKQHQIELDREKMFQKIREVASMFRDSEKMVQMIYQNNEMLQNIQSEVLEAQLVDKLLATANLIEQHKSYSEALNVLLTQ